MKLSSRFTDALVYAAAKHGGQVRKGTTVPYVAHVERASPSVLLVSAADKLHNARAILCDYREIHHDQIRADARLDRPRFQPPHFAPSSRLKNFTARSHASSAALRS